MPLIDLAGCRLHYSEYGNGRPLILIHGFPLSGAMWDEVLPALAREHRVIVPDLRGFGQSPWPADQPPQSVAELPKTTMTMADYADDLIALLDALEVREPAIACGLSMGGYVTFQLMLRHAARFAGWILCDTRAANDAPAAAAARATSAHEVLTVGSDNLINTMLGRLFAGESLTRDPSLLPRFRSMMSATDVRAIAAAQTAMAARPDVREQLHTVTAPVLSIVGEDDVISPPAETAAWTAEFPRGRLVRLPGCGHMTPNEDPAAWLAAVTTWCEEQRL